MPTIILLLTLILPYVYSFDLLSVRRHLEKEGLHRLLVTETTYVIDKESEF